MVDLSDLEKRLNKDPELRAKFLKNPSAVLKEEGLVLNTQMKKDLKELVAQAKEPKKGVGVRGVGVAIRIRF